MSQGPGERHRWIGSPPLPYRVNGLLVWGASSATRFLSARIGPIEVLKLSDAPIPAEFFRAEYPYSRFQAFLDETRIETDRFLHGQMKEIPPHHAFQRAIARTCPPDVHLEFVIEGPIDALMTFGYATAGGGIAICQTDDRGFEEI